MSRFCAGSMRPQSTAYCGLLVTGNKYEKATLSVLETVENAPSSMAGHENHRFPMAVKQIELLNSFTGIMDTSLTCCINSFNNATYWG